MLAPVSKPARLDILRAGDWRDIDGKEVSLTNADLAQIAAAYMPDLAAAPLIQGGKRAFKPVIGRVADIELRDGALCAVLDCASATTREWVRQKLCKRLFVSLWLPDTPGNPMPGQFYLSHVRVRARLTVPEPPLSLVPFAGVTIDASKAAPRVNADHRPVKTLSEADMAMMEMIASYARTTGLSFLAAAIEIAAEGEAEQLSTEGK